MLFESKRNLFMHIVKLSPIMASKLLFWRTFKQRLNLENPQTFYEKLMWLKLFEDVEFKSKFTDKVQVRNYLTSAGYGHLLVPVIDISERVEDIIFEQLPKKFILRCSHGSNFQIICTNKRELDYVQTKRQLAYWMATDYSLRYAEPHYASIQPRILIEHFLEPSALDEAADYKLHCFHGEPKMIEHTVNLATAEEQTMMLTPHWQNTHYIENASAHSKTVRKPKQLADLLHIAKKLSKPFTYVRVDLTIIDEKIYFKEFLFTPGACLKKDIHEQADRELGQWIHLEHQKLKSPISIA